eukprot:TRINITY_DN16341_c0_g2_i1.p1 TRINITY_DN16341_c0_g2~~TRINITY_DN16341_c0_g2_i1.p1  ORF type:complete len:596 (-),score=106.02 TRINITY_DN16341_c0_g2_i1:443-2155(-)
MDSFLQVCKKFDSNGTGLIPVASLEHLGFDKVFSRAIEASNCIKKEGYISYLELHQWLNRKGTEDEYWDLLGVSLHHLSGHLVERIQRLTEVSYTDATVKDIAEPIIKQAGADLLCPRDLRRGAAYVEALKLQPDSFQSLSDHQLPLKYSLAERSTHMLSYSWRYRVMDIIDALCKFCNRYKIRDAELFVWMCCFCVNQHRVEEAKQVSFADFKQTFETRVMRIPHMIALMDPWESPQYLTRVWCVFEFYTVISRKSSSDVTILVPPAHMDSFQNSLQQGHIDSLWQVLTDFDVGKAVASVPEDQDKILKMVKEGHGIDALNKAVADAYRKWMLRQTEECVVQAQVECARQAMQAGVVAGRLNDKLQAAKHYEHALLLLKLCGISENELTADVYLRYGSLKGGSGDHEGQALMYDEAYRMRKRLGILETPSGASLLAGMAFACADPIRAESYFQDALKIRKDCGTECTHEAANLFKGLAELQVREQKFDEAHANLEQAYAIREKIGKLETPDGAKLLELQGDVSLRSSNPDEALKFYIQAQNIYSRVGYLSRSQEADLAAKIQRCRTQRP